MPKKKTDVAFLLDQTGSMAMCKDDTIGGFNTFISEQRRLRNNISFSFTLFNGGGIEKRYVNESLRNIKDLSEDSYRPSHMTPLWDAIGSTIGELGAAENVLFIILTDGEENCSREFSAETVKSLIETKKKDGWEFLFLGADISDFGGAQMLGIHDSYTTQKGNMRGTYRNIGCTVSNFCSTGEVTYNDEDKETTDGN